MALIATAAIFTGGLPYATPRPVPPVDDSVTALLSAPEGGWVWFNAPNAIHRGARTIFGYISGDGHPMAAQYDHDTGIVSTPQRLYPSHTFESDDHDDAALLRRSSDGRILAYYSKHTANDHYVNVSTNPDDASAWDGPTNIGAAIGAGTVTYMQPVELPSGTIRVFFRDHFEGTSSSPEWAYADAADGETFSGHTSFVRDQGVLTYVTARMGADGRIDFVASGHPAYDTGGSIWHFYWEDGSYYRSDGTLIESALPLDTADMTEVYDGSTTFAWHWDIARVAGDLAIVFATFPGNDGTEHRYQHARWTGSAWAVSEVADAGSGLYSPEVFYSGGIAIDRTDTDLVWYSSNAAGSYDIFRGVRSGETWTPTQMTDDATKDIRPKAIVGHRGALYLRGAYTSYFDWDTGTQYVGP